MLFACFRVFLKPRFENCPFILHQHDYGDNNQGIPIKRLNSVFFHRLLFQSLAGWFVGGCLFGHPPTRFLIFLDKFRGKPLRKNHPKRHPPMPPEGHWRRDVLFAPAVDGTHRQLQSKCDGRSYWVVWTLTLFKLSIGIKAQALLHRIKGI